MVRPVDTLYRRAILEALDLAPVVSMADINEHLKKVGQYKSYQSTRRMVLKLEQTGNLTIEHKRGEKNSLLISKKMLSPHLVLRSRRSGVPISLESMINEIMHTRFPGFIKEESQANVANLMVDYILASDPKRFEGTRDVPDRDKIYRSFERMLDEIKDLHAMIKHFLDSDLHSPVAKTKVMSELSNVNPMVVHSLVTKTITYQTMDRDLDNAA